MNESRPAASESATLFAADQVGPAPAGRVITYPDEESWLDARLAGVGASEVPAILGLVGWGSEYSLWLEKTGIVPRELLTAPRLRRGRKLEPLIAEEYSEATGRTLQDLGRHTICWSDKRLLFATLDRLILPSVRECSNCGRIHDGPGVFEAKSAYGFLAQDWEEAAPLGPQAQHQTQLGSTGLSWGVIGAWIGLEDFKFYCYEADRETFALIERRAERFWQNVREKLPPLPDASDATRIALSKAFPIDDGREVELPDEAIVEHARLDLALDELQRWKREEKQARNRLKAMMGSASIGRIGDITYQLKTVNRSAYTVEATKYRRLTRRDP